ncbi:hypothetical protein ABK040_005285 [Willaertia magna]
MKKIAGLFGKKSSSGLTENEKNKIRNKLVDKSVEEWNIKDVSDWLKSIDLSEYCKEFEKMDIAGAELLELTDDDLVRDLKIVKLGHRKRFKKQLEYLLHNNDILFDDDELSSTSTNNTVGGNKDNMNNNMTPSSSVTSSYLGTNTIMEFNNNNSLQQRGSLGNNINTLGTSYQSSIYDVQSNCSSSLVLDQQDVLSNSLQQKRFVNNFDNDNMSSVSNNSTQSTSSMNPNILLFKIYDGEEAFVIRLDINYLNNNCLEYLKKEILNVKSQWFTKTDQIHLKYKDEDGDVISIKRNEDLLICINIYRNNNTNNNNNKYIKIYLSTNHSLTVNTQNTNAVSAIKGTTSNNLQKKEIVMKYSKESEELIAILESMVDSVIIITASDKLIKYVNKACEKLLGFTRNELLLQNVNIFMPSSYRANHDGYIDKYLETGESKIINKGRLVPVKLKNGKVMDCWLSVNETIWEEERAFTGTLKMIYTNSSTTSSPNTLNSMMKEQQITKIPFLENMVDAVIIITGNDDIIRYFNKSAETLLGYKREEVIGQEIGIFIPDDEIRLHHNEYVQRYMKTGEARVVGIGRAVKGITKEGKIIDVFLSVNETKWNQGKDGRAFIGTLKSLEDEQLHKFI